MKRSLTILRLLALALVALGLLIASPVTHAAPAARPVAGITCDKNLLKQAHDEAQTAIAYMNVLDGSIDSANLTTALNAEKQVVKYTTDCKHVSTAFNKATEAANAYYNFYYYDATSYNAWTDGAFKRVGNTLTLMGQVASSVKK